MSEESMLILTMLGDGKITAEQADSLLRAVREAAPAQAAIPAAPAPPALPAPPAPALPPPPPLPPAPETLDAMQAKLAELQGKIGDLQGKLGEAQGKLGAAQAAHSSDGGVEFWAGKVADFLPNIDVSKIMDEAMKGFGSLKSDAVRAAREAARQAAQEARRAAREAGQNAREAGQEARRSAREGRQEGRQGRREWKFEFNWDGCKSEGTTERPENSQGWPEAEDVAQTIVNWVGADKLILINPFGNVKAVGRDDLHNQAEATVTKTAWAETEADARVLLQQVFLTHRTENGEARLEIVAPDDGRKRIAVDYEVFVPTGIALEIQTTHGEAEAEDASSALTIATVSGDIAARRSVPHAAPHAARLSSRSGNVSLEQWETPHGSLEVETISGEVEAEGLRVGQNARLFTKSGDIAVEEMQIAGELRVEALSGEVKLEGGSVGAALTVKTQSGEIAVQNLRAATMTLESVSGDIDTNEISGVLTVKSVSGDLEVKDLRSQSVALTTVSGDAELSFAAPFTGSLAGTTVSGDLSVTLWDNSETRIEMTTMTGDLECELPLSDKTENGKRLTGTLGAGTGSLRLQSVSGDLKIEPLG